MELKQHQPSMNVAEQIENLKSINLVIENENYARDILNDISYFRLIKAYGLGLKEKNKNFDGNITFEQIVDLYLFNAKFRQLLFTQVERVEVNLRCRVANYFSHTYGVFGYENEDNFCNSRYHSELINEINTAIQKNKKSPFVMNFKNNYVDKKIPLYALVELISFGTLSKFYKNLKPHDKKMIAEMYKIRYNYLESWIEHIAFVRNICAHYGRIYNVNLSKTPKLYKQYSEQHISNIRIFATLLCIKHLVPDDCHWEKFVDNINLLLNEHSNVDIKLMGFPDNWNEILLS